MLTAKGLVSCGPLLEVGPALSIAAFPLAKKVFRHQNLHPFLCPLGAHIRLVVERRSAAKTFATYPLALYSSERLLRTAGRASEFIPSRIHKKTNRG